MGLFATGLLTALGLDQSRIAAQAIASDCGALGADLILSSDLNRAVQTARVIGEVAGGELILDLKLDSGSVVFK